MNRNAIVSSLFNRTGGSTLAGAALLIGKMPLPRVLFTPLRVVANLSRGYGIREYIFIKTEERRLLRDARQLDRRDWFYDCGVVPSGWTVDHLVGLLVSDPLAERRLTRALVVAACKGVLAQGTSDSTMRLPVLLERVIRRNPDLADQFNYSPPMPPADYLARQVTNGTFDQGGNYQQ